MPYKEREQLAGNYRPCDEDAIRDEEDQMNEAGAVMAWRSIFWIYLAGSGFVLWIFYKVIRIWV